MKIIEITASYSCKKQVRQYEPIDIFMGAKAEIDGDTEDVAEAQRALFQVVKQMVNELIAKLGGRDDE